MDRLGERVYIGYSIKNLNINSEEKIRVLMNHFEKIKNIIGGIAFVVDDSLCIITFTTANVSYILERDEKKFLDNVALEVI